MDQKNSEKSEKKKPGLKKGQTNNPNGRPKGSKNILTLEIKERLATYLANNFNTFESDLKALNDMPHVRAKLFLEVAKLIIPRPLNEDEEKEQSIRYSLFANLFKKNSNG